MGTSAIIVFVLVLGFLYGTLKNPRPAGTKSNSGWVGLLVLCVLLGGLFFASKTGNESLAWFFGIALWAAIPAMLLFAVGMAAGRMFKGGRDEKL
jgi:hypothetical protein